MEKSYKIAVVVVTYNRKDLLIKCLRALADQTYKPHTIFIIDNNSSDGTEAYLKAENYYNSKIKGIHFLYFCLPTNQGGAGGFYTGIRAANESVENFDGIWVMDDDGIPDKGCLQQLALHLDVNDYIAPMVLAVEDKTKLAFPYYDINSPTDLINRYGEKVPNYACPFNGILYSRKLIQNIGYPIPELFIWGDEENYNSRAIEAGFTSVTITTAIHYHPQCKNVFKKSLFGRNIVFVPEMWKGYCHYRNKIYNWKKKWKLHNFVMYWITNQYYFIFKIHSWKWFLLFNNAFFDGLSKKVGKGYVKYMNNK